MLRNSIGARERRILMCRFRRFYRNL